MRKLRNHIDGRVHFSDLKAMRESAAHYRYAIEHPRTELTRAMLVGAIGDALVFGGPRKVARFDGTRRGPEWISFQRDHEGEILCNASEYSDASGAALAVLNDPASGPLVKDSATEKQRVVQWDDWGLPCAAGIAGADGRGGFDMLDLVENWITDMKITADASPRAIERQILTMAWHAQLAFYVDGCRALGMGAMGARLICVEATPPHPVTVIELKPDLLDYGRRSLSAWTERLKQCEASDEWPGYVQEPVEMGLPEWAET